MNSHEAKNRGPSVSVPNMEAAEPAYDVIVVGAGAAGLAAAADLCAAGFKVLLLDARDRIGGRIDTRREPGWLSPIERGAEFVHGVPQETWGLIRTFRVVAIDINTSDLMWTGDKLEPGEDFWGDSQAVIARLDRVTGEDQSFQAFLEQHAADLPARAKEAASAYVEGFNAADRNIISAQSLARAELASDEIEGDRLFRVLDGYDALMAALWQTAAAHGAALRLSSLVTAVDWSRGEVRVTSIDENGVSKVDRASKAIITLPVGVLQAEPPAVGAVRFTPALHAKRHALASLRSGAVVKAVLRFKSAFWERHVSFDLSFFHALGQPFPTWWTSLPVRDTVLTGWSGGPAAERLAKLADAEVLERAVDTLARLFKLDRAAILRELEASQICNWQVDPLARGAYSYVAVGGLAAPAELAAPLEDTLFFAGEATHTGVSGTVDGAIASGRRAAREIRALSTKDEERTI